MTATHPSRNGSLRTPGGRGVRIIGTGRHAPQTVWDNDRLREFMDTSDEWIRQRTGIASRHVCDPDRGETTRTLATKALTNAIEDAKISPREIDLVIVATISGETTCPATACRVAADAGASGAGAFDLLAACSGFVYGMNVAHDLIKGGNYNTIAVIGCDAMSRIIDFSNRTVGILFGDAAGAAILRASGDPAHGLVCSAMHADGSNWHDLYLPHHEADLPDGLSAEDVPIGTLQMQGKKIYKFAVGRFPALIQKTLDNAGLAPDQVDHYICHQSNARMLESARDRVGIPEHKLPINIDRYGNCSGGSVPVLLDELRKDGKCNAGETVMFVAFGAGLTWGSSLWKL